MEGLFTKMLRNTRAVPKPWRKLDQERSLVQCSFFDIRIKDGQRRSRTKRDESATKVNKENLLSSIVFKPDFLTYAELECHGKCYLHKIGPNKHLHLVQIENELFSNKLTSGAKYGLRIVSAPCSLTRNVSLAYFDVSYRKKLFLNGSRRSLLNYFATVKFRHNGNESNDSRLISINQSIIKHDCTEQKSGPDKISNKYLVLSQAFNEIDSIALSPENEEIEGKRTSLWETQEFEDEEDSTLRRLGKDDAESLGVEYLWKDDLDLLDCNYGYNEAFVESDQFAELEEECWNIKTELEDLNDSLERLKLRINHGTNVEV